LRVESLDKLADVPQLFADIAMGAVGVVWRVDRVLDDRADTGFEMILKAERFEHRQNIRVHHDAVGLKPLVGLQ